MIATGFFLLLATLASPECNSGTAIVVRHAEKFMTGDAEKDRDAPLSDSGRERAEALAQTLADAGIDAIYSSPYQRTRSTAAPLASRLGLAVREVSVAEKDAAARLATQVMDETCGREALIVGHSNTVPDVLLAFGVEGSRQIADHQYDNLFLVDWRRGQPARLLVLHYGRPTP